VDWRLTLVDDDMKCKTGGFVAVRRWRRRPWEGAVLAARKMVISTG
jgi:hypothetical protein